MLKILILTTLAVSIAAQIVVPVQPQGQFFPPGYQDYPSLAQSPLTPFNAPLDGYYGFNPYLAPNGFGVPQQNPFVNGPLNLPTGPGVPPQTAFFNPIYNNAIPPVPAFGGGLVPPQIPFPGFQQIPQFPPFAQVSPPAAGSQPASQQQVVQHGRPFSDATAVSFTRFQTGPNNSTGPAPVTATQGVNSGVPRPVAPVTPYVNGNNGNGILTGGYGPVYAAPASNALNPAVAQPSRSR
ncbi:uncharacterized protein LOC131428018 [Malaya genurostris]|uniref:uncharacterized protein LOC131428018 n=1 Tax=Malaya genurostris TaxID=325434 RepID=UPI0026F3E57A|nr:uncharacterized protein LOC131428018 [Malaya genurostris]